MTSKTKQLSDMMRDALREESVRLDTEEDYRRLEALALQMSDQVWVQSQRAWESLRIGWLTPISGSEIPRMLHIYEGLLHELRTDSSE